MSRPLPRASNVAGPASSPARPDPALTARPQMIGAADPDPRRIASGTDTHKLHQISRQAERVLRLRAEKTDPNVEIPKFEAEVEKLRERLVKLEIRLSDLRQLRKELRAEAEPAAPAGPSKRELREASAKEAAERRARKSATTVASDPGKAIAKGKISDARFRMINELNMLRELGLLPDAAQFDRAASMSDEDLQKFIAAKKLKLMAR